MAMKLQQQEANEGLARELGQSIILLALTGSSVGGFLGMVAIATRALGH
ncbi:MAG: hypothetical protein QOC87_137 [Actinomycetota bacterium]|jgi:hypothetical protein|nr:hypothetical protein [Actinomycetota bacterium]